MMIFLIGQWKLIHTVLIILNISKPSKSSFMGWNGKSRAFLLRKPKFDFIRRKMFSVAAVKPNANAKSNANMNNRNNNDVNVIFLMNRRRRRRQRRSPTSTYSSPSLSEYFKILRGGSDTYSDSENENENEDGDHYHMKEEYEEEGKHDHDQSLMLESSSDEEENVLKQYEETVSQSSSNELHVQGTDDEDFSRERMDRKVNRHTSNMILELDQRSSVSNNDESLALRHLITTRTAEYIDELQEAAAQLQSDDDNDVGADVECATLHDIQKRLPHPRNLLHFLAKKVPAIKQSPDVNLRIHSSRSDIDPGVAACLIGRLAFACEQYEQILTGLTKLCNRKSKSVHEEDSLSTSNNINNRSNNGCGNNKSKNEQPEPAAPQLTTDRRFEQLIECVISGVNIKKRKEEFLKMRDKSSTDDVLTDIEEVLDEEGAHFDEGLNIRDACRAAWGIAILGAHYMESLGGVKVKDLFVALSLRVRELLLARLQELRQGDILSSSDDDGCYHYVDDNGNEKSNKEPRLMTTEERLNVLAEELAEDAASAMWAFGCVRACTGISSAPLFEACCSILCQDPLYLRRRAQEADYEPSKNPIFGSNDVIDRLAQNAEEDEVETGCDASTDGKRPIYNEDKDAFLDWLSPIEVTDILWALALHGSNVTSSLDDVVTLSETASTLRETAYDRLVEWLEEDLAETNEPQSKFDLETSSEKESIEEVTEVEVVDAATLLASGDESSTADDDTGENQPAPTESIAMEASSIVRNDVESQEVEVVDAAKLLASSDNEDESTVVETEIMVAPASIIEDNSVSCKSKNNDGSSFDRGSDVSVHLNENNSRRIFSSHDLASIAWSVTELRDPLRTYIVGLVVELLYRLGPNSVASLSGTDLSNLAWAIAKHEGKNHSGKTVPITHWIADRALQRTREYPLLTIVTPPELGRIMWAIACTTSTKSSTHECNRPNTSSFFLTQKALKAASDNLTAFSTETLVRIAWAHLEINDSDLTVLTSSEMLALGKVLAAAEHSLHRWERVDFGDVPSTESHVDSPLFSSFFGRPRRNLPILEQAVNDDDEDDMDLAPLGRSQRPKLRDLMIDPSTLCKAACAFQRLSATHPYLKGGWTFTRVAVRLLSSKNARLMNECSIHDIVRLCEAAVLSDTDGHGREIVIGLFSRQVVKLLNEIIVEDGGNHQDCSVNIRSASSSEISTLIWALGEMGVKHAKHSSSKKMRLVFVEPLLQHIDVQSLNLTDLQRLVRGLVLMKITPIEKPILLKALKKISDEASTIPTGKEICTVTETIGILKEALNMKKKKQDVPSKQVVESESVKLKDENLSEISGAEIMSFYDELSLRSDDVLNEIAKLAIELSKNMTAKEIRRVLEVYSLLPFQADALIHCLSNEIQNRMIALGDLKSTKQLHSLLKDASRKSSIVQTSLFDDSSASLFSSIRAGIMSFFGSANDDKLHHADQITDDGAALTEELVSIIHALVAATSDAASRAEADQSALQVSLDNVMKTLREEASFELGRSLELIENYHRTEFSTGGRRSRYDKDRKNYISKRILSRLLP